MITQEKWNALKKEMNDCDLKESDLEEQFVKGSGKGGQKVNKTSSCVVLSHKPTGLSVSCQKTRFREDNRFFARRLLLEAFKEKELGIPSQKTKQTEKIRKQKERRKRRSDS